MRRVAPVSAQLQEDFHEQSQNLALVRFSPPALASIAGGIAINNAYNIDRCSSIGFSIRKSFKFLTGRHQSCDLIRKDRKERAKQELRCSFYLERNARFHPHQQRGQKKFERAHATPTFVACPDHHHDMLNGWHFVRDHHHDIRGLSYDHHDHYHDIHGRSHHHGLAECVRRRQQYRLGHGFAFF